jgi:hypothetical protein
MFWMLKDIDLCRCAGAQGCRFWARARPIRDAQHTYRSILRNPSQPSTHPVPICSKLMGSPHQPAPPWRPNQHRSLSPPRLGLIFGPLSSSSNKPCWLPPPDLTLPAEGTPGYRQTGPGRGCAITHSAICPTHSRSPPRPIWSRHPARCSDYIRMAGASSGGTRRPRSRPRLITRYKPTRNPARSRCRGRRRGRMARTWTAEQREAQRRRCLETKPWLNASGPKTPEGKARASLNATKHLMYSRHNFRRTLARILALAKQEQEALVAMRSWLPDAITLKLKNPELYAELEKIADQNSNEL